MHHLDDLVVVLVELHLEVQAHELAQMSPGVGVLGAEDLVRVRVRVRVRVIGLGRGLGVGVGLVCRRKTTVVLVSPTCG